MSLYREKHAPSLNAPVSPATVNDQEGVATTESPTGAPAISPKAVPWLTGVVALALVLSRSLGPHTVAAQVAEGVVDVAVLFGLASPGWRRKQ